jgi:hypothetical protein
MIYDAPVSISRTNNAITNLQFILGGVAVSSLESGRTYFMDIDATSNMSDLLSIRPVQSSATELHVAGNLVVNLLTGTITGGQSFHLFDADLFSGAFDSIVLPTLPSNVTWDISQLLVNGTLTTEFVPAPEPSTLLLGTLGIALIASGQRRRRAQRGA